MKLALCRIPSDVVRGIYTVRGKANRMPDRALFLHPAAARDFLAIASRVVVSDMFRSAEASLAAVRAKRGAQPPGYSAHNYGLAIDVDIAATRHGFRATSKRDLDHQMAAHGFYCLRTDHDVSGFEAWHYSHLGRGAKTSSAVLLTAETEARLRSFYGPAWRPNGWQCQAALKRLRLYHGDEDGILGPLSIEAMMAFKRTWGLNGTGVFDSKSRRTLAYVAAEREIIELAELP